MLALPAPPFTVLVVDDNADCADSLGLLVRLWGHYATVAYDGASALVLAERLHPDVALLDLGMRDMGGCELGRQLRSMPGLSRLTLVAVTGYADDGHRSEALAAGFAFHVSKPADLKALESLLRVVARQKAQGGCDQPT